MNNPSPVSRPSAAPLSSWAPGMVVRNGNAPTTPLPTGAGFRPIQAGAKTAQRPSLRVTGWWTLLILSLILAGTFGAAASAFAAESAPVVEPPKIVPPATAPASPGGSSSDAVIYPKNSPSRPKNLESDGSGFPTTGLAVVLLLLAAGGYLVLKRGNFLNKPVGNTSSRLAIEETRPLGNKQFLAVATYGGRKMLIAVCPGKIDLLCRLDDSGASVNESARAVGHGGDVAR